MSRVCRVVYGFLVCSLAGMALANPCPAQSLWDKRDPAKAFLFYDVQARRVGDLLTLIIGETTDVANQEQRKLGKVTDSRSKFGLSHSASGVFGNSTGELAEDFSSSSDRNFDGNAKFSSARAFVDQMTVTVTDVLPNGNLVISGKRRVNVDGDERDLVVSGIVRYWDVRANNTIHSRYVSGLKMAYEGRGTEQRFTKQGWLGRATNKLWPF
jgi:flagellar L-ring protein precursor FlgH